MICSGSALRMMLMQCESVFNCVNYLVIVNCIFIMMVILIQPTNLGPRRLAPRYLATHLMKKNENISLKIMYFWLEHIKMWLGVGNAVTTLTVYDYRLVRVDIKQIKQLGANFMGVVNFTNYNTLNLWKIFGFYFCKIHL